MSEIKPCPEITAIIQDVCELPDRTSPDDWPEACLVTPEELIEILSGPFAELTASLNRASDACASVQRERDEAMIVLRRLVQSVDELISESAGVYGLHLNGDPAPWDELTVAGPYEEWLIELECSRAFLSRYEGEVK